MVGALAGLGGGLAVALAGCDGDRPTSNTTATVSPSQTITTTVETSTSTTAVVGPETGRTIKVGVVSAVTGSSALSGKADTWWIEFASKALPDGLVCGDGKLHRLTVLQRDGRSDPAFAARAAAGLITDDRVDLIMVSGDADWVNSVAYQAETLVCPCLCSMVPWRPFVFGRDGSIEKPLRWAYAHGVGLEDVAASLVAAWDQLQTNKKIGFVFSDGADGRSWADVTTGLPPVAAAAGYEWVLPDLGPLSGGDFADYVSEFKKNGCEICFCALDTDSFVDLWQQSVKQNYRPTILSTSRAVLFPHALDATGRAARNVTAESLWQPDWPYRDSISGKTCRELAYDFMAQSGDQWIAYIAQYAKFEWAVDVFRRVRDVGSRQEVIAQVARTELDTCLGRIDFTTRIGAADPSRSRRPAENVCKAPVGVAQWVEGDAFAFEPRLVAAVNSPNLPVTGTMEPMEYAPA